MRGDDLFPDSGQGSCYIYILKYYKIRKNINNQNRTKKNYKKSNKTNSHIVKVFLEVLNMVKLYHWKTRSYAQHEATDELYLKLNKHIDSFVEVLLGKDERRIKMLEKRIDLIDPSNTRDVMGHQ